MFAMVHLDKISGGDFFEVLRNLILQCIPNGETVGKVLSDYAVLFLVLGIAVGISQCFFGYKLRELWTAILMIVLCGCVSMLLAAEFEVSTAGLIALTAGMSIAGGLLGYFLWVLGCFLRPFAAISVVVFAAFAVYGMQTLGLIVGLAAGLIAGIVAVAFYRKGLMVYSALFGGMLAGECIWLLTGIEVWYPGLILGGILAFAGILVQLFTNRKPKEMTADGKAGQTDATAGQEIGEGAENEQEKAGQGKTEQGKNGQGKAEQGKDEQERTGQDGWPQAGSAAELLAAADEGISQSDGLNGASAAGFCPSCGAPRSAKAKFCMQCGQKLHQL